VLHELPAFLCRRRACESRCQKPRAASDSRRSKRSAGEDSWNTQGSCKEERSHNSEIAAVAQSNPPAGGTRPARPRFFAKVVLVEKTTGTTRAEVEVRAAIFADGGSGRG